MNRILFFALLLFAPSLSPAATSVEKLLAKSTRPTMEEVRLVLDDIPKWSGIPVSAANVQGYFDTRIDLPSWRDQLFIVGPKLIAEFEKTTPGATWVFLGRDGLPWADLFDAYYLSLGQKGRVIRLGMSKPTLASATPESLLNLMRSHGIKTEDLDKVHPYIFVDSVSGGNGRQGRRLLGELYSNWISKDRDPLQIIDKIDMIGMIVSTFKAVPNDIALKPLHQYLQALFFLNGINPNAGGDWIGNQLRIMTYPESDNAGNEAGYTHFIGAWHDTFQKINETPAGQYFAQPGAVYPEEMRQSVLWLQKEIWKFVNRGDCHARVTKHARSRDYNFPLERAPVRTANYKQLQKFRSRLTERSRTPREAQILATHARDLGVLLAYVPVGPGDRNSLLAAYGNQPGQLVNMDWNMISNPNSPLEDIQQLQLALGSSCEAYLGRQ